MLKALRAALMLGAPLLLIQPALAREAAKGADKGTEAPARAPSAGQTAARERQKKCGTEWRGLSDAQKTAQGPKWPQYWSKCNARLKGEKA
ncbi:hypothetical protein [Methylobacterium sp. A54F]